MRRLLAFAILATFVAAPAFSQMVLVEDWSGWNVDDLPRNSYPEYDPNWDGANPPADDTIWHTMRNGDWNVATTNPESLIVADGGNGQKVGRIINSDATQEFGFGPSAVALDIPDIASKGTIYMKIKGNEWLNTAICTNALTNSKFGTSNASQLAADGQQGFHDWSSQSTIARFEWAAQTFNTQTNTYPFDARNGTGYTNSSNTTLNADSWYEFWIQLDGTTESSKYFIRELGDTNTPQAISINGSDDTWSYRVATFGAPITTLKFHVSSPFIAGPQDVGYLDNWSCEEDCETNELLITDIGVNTSAMTLETVGTFVPGDDVNTCETVNAAVGDFNCDNLVNLTDLVTLGENYNVNGDYTMGDTNADGLINLTDLVTLGENYNTTVSTPEPASLGLLAIGGLLAIRRR